MRQAFAHEAVVTMGAGTDPRAPGAAITVALCGHWEHPPPCPLAAHHTAVEPVAGTLRLRTLFAAEPADEAEVRARIRTALEAGRVPGRDGPDAARWRLDTDGPAAVRPDEGEHARRLAAG